MKNSQFKRFVLIGLFLFVFINVGAQKITDENTYLINQYFKLNNDASLLLENKVASIATIQSQYNFTILSQIGKSNQIDIKGNNNDTQTLNQFGNNNDYQFINYYNNSASNFTIMQQGNSNSLQIYGENSLIKNMSIVQKGSFEALIIKNY